MVPEQNKALVRRLLERADADDVTVLDELLAEDYVDHNPPPFQGPTPGAAGAREAFHAAEKIFSDWHHEVIQQFADGDYVISHIRGRGRHTGDFMGVPATEKELTMEGIAVHRVVDGKLVEHWSQVDGLGMLVQMGVVPPPGG